MELRTQEKDWRPSQGVIGKKEKEVEVETKANEQARDE